MEPIDPTSTAMYNFVKHFSVHMAPTKIYVIHGGE
ncbi:hypothetical protein OROMI_021784 [Orobanche minor]